MANQTDPTRSRAARQNTLNRRRERHAKTGARVTRSGRIDVRAPHPTPAH